MRRRPIAAAAAVLAGIALLVAGCTSTPSTSAVAAYKGPATIGLVGLWRVSDAAGESSQSWLWMSNADVMLWSKCGVYDGDWRAAEGRIVFGFSGVQYPRCDNRPIDTEGPAWAKSAAFYVKTASGWSLENSAHLVVATLAVKGNPPRARDYSSDYTEQPDQNDQEVKWFRKVAPLPSNAHAVNLVGRWVPVGAKPSKGFATFSSDGTFSGSDGCNEATGRWVSGRGGLLLTTSGLITLVGCDGSSLQYWALNASRAGMVGHHLVFYSSSGKRLGEAVRG